MFEHYLKVAVRNLKKYKLQSIISIIGLAVGFVCFALSMIWIRYEMTYDTFHKDADCIYRVRQKSILNSSGLSPYTPYPLASYLKNTFPEIKTACALKPGMMGMTINGSPVKVDYLEADSAFFETFSVPILSGNKSILQPESKVFAVTDKAARKWFGKEDPIGKEVTTWRGSPKTIEAVTSSWSTHSNIPFDVIEPIVLDHDMKISVYHTYIKLQKGTDVKALLKKLSGHAWGPEYLFIDQLVLTPITSIHYKDPNNESKVKFGHVILFAVSGGLVIFCALFNFLTLFVSRIRIRGKELALRKVNGANNSSSFFLLCTELLLILFCSITMGILLMELAQPQFIELAQMQNKEGGIFGDILLYAGVVTVGAFLISILPVQYFRRKTLLATIQGKSGSYGRNLFRRGSILLQLIVSVGLMFCTSVLFKQVYFLSNTDLGLARENVSTLSLGWRGDYSLIPVIKQEMEKLSSMQEVLDVQFSLFPQHSSMSSETAQWEDRPSDAKPVSIEWVYGGPELISFYNFTFVDGKGFLSQGNPKGSVVVNETLCKSFGWHDPIGKKFDHDGYEVIGVIKDYYNLSPVTPPHPVAILFTEAADKANNRDIVYKYMDNQKENSEQQIRKLFKEKFPEVTPLLLDAKVEYAKYIQSENYLLLLLGFISAVCVVVCAFGVYSLASLTTEEKRKSIAVRKVNGATTSDILKMFFRENMLLLCIASAIAFPVGYVIMKSFLQSYTTQTEIAFWLFLSIFLFNGLVVISSVFSSVWKAANENPAHVVKSE